MESSSGFLALNVNGFAATTHGTRGRLDQLDNAQAELAVGDRYTSAFHASHEMVARNAQGFGHVELRRPHVATSVTHPELVYLLCVVGEADPAVVHLDLFRGLHIVIDDHLLATAKQDLAHLHRCQP